MHAGFDAVHAAEQLSRSIVNVLFALTIAREVAQVEPRGGDLRHVVEAEGCEFSTDAERARSIGRVNSKEAYMMEKKINTKERIRSK